MKRIILSILVWSMSTAVLWGDDKPSQNIATQLNKNAMHMVSMGVKVEHAIKLQNRFQERQIVQARNILQSAKNQGVPVQPIVDKALEGVAKKVNITSILHAMERVRNRFTAARAEADKLTMEPSLRQSMTKTMVQTMTAGMPIEDVSVIAVHVRDRRQKMDRGDYVELAQHTFISARDMTRLGASSESVKNILSIALQKQYSALQMKMLGNKFMHQSLGNNTSAVADHFFRSIHAGDDVGWKGPSNRGRTRSGLQDTQTSQRGGRSSGGTGSGNGEGGGMGNGGGRSPK